MSLSDPRRTHHSRPKEGIRDKQAKVIDFAGSIHIGVAWKPYVRLVVIKGNEQIKPPIGNAPYAATRMRRPRMICLGRVWYSHNASPLSRAFDFLKGLPIYTSRVAPISANRGA